MTVKKQTKKQAPAQTEAKRISAEKAALKRRILDLAAGACGGFEIDYDSDVFPGLWSEMGAEQFINFYRAVLVHIIGEDNPKKHLLAYCHIPQFDNPNVLVEFLYEEGIRA